MSTIKRASPSAENSRIDDAAVLPASMQTLLDRYTERTLSTEERRTLARATPNLRCKALRIFFEMNDAAAAVEYVLSHGGASPTPASSSQRRSMEGSSRSRPSVRNSNSNIDASRSKSSRSAASLSSTSTSVPRLATATVTTSAQNALKVLPTNVQPFGASKPAVPSSVFNSSNNTDPLPGAVAIAVSPVPTPQKQKIMRPQSLSVNGSGGVGVGHSSGSRPRRVSAARRGESVCTLVTVSSMSDKDDEENGDGALRHGASVSGRDDDSRNFGEEDEGEETQEEMPPTVTLRSRELRSNAASGNAVPSVPALVLDSVVKPNDENANSNNSNTTALLPVASAPVDRPSCKSAMPTTTTFIAATASADIPAPVREVSPSVLPPPGAHRIETPIVPSPSPCPPVPVAADVSAPPHSTEDGEEEKTRKTVAAKPAKAMNYKAGAVETTAATAASLPSPKTTLRARKGTSDPHRKQQQHHVAFTDAKAMALLDAYRNSRALPLGYRDEVELAYTELSCGHSSVSPSCTAPSVASGISGNNNNNDNNAPKSAADWAALVASVRGPQLPAPVTGAKPATPALSSTQSECHTAASTITTATGKTTAGADALRTSRCSGQSGAVSTPRRSAAEAATVLPQPQCTTTPRASQEEGSKRKSDGSVASSKKQTSTTTAVSATVASVLPAQWSPHRKRLSNHKEPQAGSAEVLNSPVKAQTQGRVANASLMKRGVAWDDITGTYITHPNQRRRQLESAALGATVPQPASSSITFRAAGASALETPDVLHAYFGRTVSTAIVAEGNGELMTTPRLQMLARTNTNTNNGGESAVMTFGRLCSSALHLHSGSGPAVKKAEKAKTPRTTPALAGPAATKKKSANSLPSFTTGRFLKKKRAAHTPVIATPRPHNSSNNSVAATPTASFARLHTDYARLHTGYAAPSGATAENADAGFQRLRSGCPAVQSRDVYRESGEVISLQRQASQYYALPSALTEALRHLASAVPAIRRASLVFDDEHDANGTAIHDAEIQPAGYFYCPSTIRSPCTARALQEENTLNYSNNCNINSNSGGWFSARGPLYHRSASNYHDPHQLPPHNKKNSTFSGAGAKNNSGTAAVNAPAMQCGVFERLTSNYYSVYTSAAALRAPPSPTAAATATTGLGSPRGRNAAANSGLTSGNFARRRNVSAPAGNAARRAAKRNAYPALREGWLSPDGKVAATQRVEEEAACEDVAAAAAPAMNAFVRSNTSCYLNLNKLCLGCK